MRRKPVVRKNEYWMERSNFNLLLKKILERLAGVAGARNVLGGNSWTRLGSRRRGIFFDGRAKFVKPAIVALILAGNTFENRLHAFKSRRRVEVRALFAGVKLESAFRAFAFGIETLLQDSAAIGTSRARDGANHTRRPRPDLFLSRMAFGRPFLFLLGLFGAHVAPLLILPLQWEPPGENYIIR
jgi:hypothetical protein